MGQEDNIKGTDHVAFDAIKLALPWSLEGDSSVSCCNKYFLKRRVVISLLCSPTSR